LPTSQKLNREIEQYLEFTDFAVTQTLFGVHNHNLNTIEQAIGVTLHDRGNSLSITGKGHAVALAASLLTQLYDLVRKGYPIFSQDIVFGIKILESSPTASLAEIFLDKVCITAQQRVISPKSLHQKDYIESIRKNDIVFGIGPAGTGKTYLAVAMAVAALSSELVQRIILTRPAVEAGEKLGFLPGDMAQKVDPYLRPLTDALNDMMGSEKVAELIERGVIEIAPLAFMRGRTLNNGFVILDEAQNTTSEQMKMFLTRIGFDAKAVITGDITQVDLPGKQASGLSEASKILHGIDGIGFNHFDHSDVVRHPLVQKIIQAYGKKEHRN
jgi:phosphate starvation-inducible PhoH-like protein